jgi:hypothetical protein
MKKSVFIAPFIISLIFFSCSNAREMNEDISEVYTIKNVVTQIGNETVWSVELEKDRLTLPVNESAPFIPEGHTLTTENAKLSSSLKPAVYPSFENFGSLDISTLEYKHLETARNICSQLSQWNQEKLFGSFPSNYRFNYIFFADELKKGWKDNFNVSFPEEEEIKLFDRWIFGEAVILDNLIQFPVRFYCNPGYVDVTLYMSPEKENTLYNIKIERWEKT